MLTRQEMIRHGEDWIAAWNRRDIESVLAGFTENAVFRSPLAAKLAGTDLLEGEAQMRAWWQAALERLDHIHFELIKLVCDEPAQIMVVHYRAELGGSEIRACEILEFGPARKIAGEALYGHSTERSEA